MTFFDKLKARESEYKEFLAKMIRVKDAEFTRLANSEVSRLNKQRHRKTRSGLHDREWFWNEEIWCQDITIMAGEEFLGEKFPYHQDPHFTDHLLFHEYFNPETGKGAGASHQTGWTGLIAKLLHGRAAHCPGA